MKVDSIERYVNTLHQLHQEIEKDPTNQKVTNAISQFLDDNQEYLTGNIEVATELNSLALAIKNSSVDDSLIKKIRGCVRQLLPDEAQSRNHTLDMLRSNGGGIRQIAEWIDLADIPVDELPLTVEERFGILGSKLDAPFIDTYLDGASLGKITEELLKHKKKWNDNERKIVIALANYCAQQDPLGIAENIQKFGIQNQEDLVEIAKRCAQKDGEATSYFIKNFGIQAQKDLVEIAKFCANQSGEGTAAYIQDFGIQNQAVLIEIAKLCAQKHGYGTVFYIKNFGIHKEGELVEVAKLCAEADGRATARYITNFGIQDQSALVEIAKLCAQKHGGATAKYIQNFGIQNPVDRLEIAKLCVQQDAKQITENIQNFGIQNQEGLIEIAKLCAQKHGGSTARHIKNFDIQNPKALTEITKLCAKNNAWKTAEHIKNFGIQNQDDLAEIAKLCAQQTPSRTAYCIKNFGIHKEAELVEVGKLCAEADGMATAIHITKFGIQDQSALVEIAKLCAQNSPCEIAFNIPNFGIQNPADRVEIAKFCAKINGGAVASNIDKFDIQDPEAMVEIAKLCAQQDAKLTTENINNFGIQDQSALVEIAKLCAQKHGGATAKYIQNFGIQNQEVLIEIARLCAQQDVKQITQNIQNFGIQNQEVLIEIAKFCAQQDAKQITENIQNFGIQNQEVLIEIAKFCAQQDAKQITQNIQNFRIQNQEVLIEIAKLCAQKHGDYTSHFIINFGIQKELALIEIAKLCAEKSGLETASSIQKFGIKNPAALIEIAKLCAKADGNGTAHHIQNFGIQKEEVLVEIAKLCIQHSPCGISYQIKNFGIQKEAVLIEIAKLCAQKSGYSTMGDIKKYGIQDRAALVEIVKLCAQQDGRGTAYYIENSGIKEQPILVEIAKLCAQQNGPGTAEFIQKFNIEDGQDRFRIFIECIKQSEESLRVVGNFAPFPELFHNVYECIRIFASNKEVHQGKKELFEALDKTIEGLECSDAHKVELQTLYNRISELDPYQQGSQTLWYLRCLASMTLLDRNALDWTLEKGLLKDLNALHNPDLRRQLSGGLFELAESEEGRNRWDQFISEKTPQKGLRLLAIPLFSLEKAGIPPGIIKKALVEILKPKIMKDALKIQRLLRLIYILGSTPIMNDEQKAFAFSKVFLGAKNETEILDNTKAAIVLLLLKDTEWTEAKDDLRELVRAAFEKTIPLVGFKGDTTQMYDKFFANSRYPAGLITYAAGLKILSEPALLTCLGRFVVSVFDGTFKSMRYDTKDNPHLTKIYEARPDLAEKWSQCREMRFENVSSEGRNQEEVFDTNDWLYSNLCRFGHLGEEDVSNVRAYLNASSSESRDTVKKSLSEEIRKCSIGKKKVDLDRDPRVLNLKIQLRCIDLARAGNERPLATLEKEFKSIKQSLEVKGVRAEFVNDVNAILAAIAQPKAPSEETFQAVITDDPLDLLYVGMDVQGSCQRLDGTPNLNKGLLGYLMDGKNQVLAIKDHSGKIAARAMLRLMWDGEKPVLFRERFYPNTISQQEKELMNKVAIQLAKALDVSITAEDGELNYGKPLHSLGGPAPWEYSDATGGPQENGVYKIETPKVLTR